MSIRRIAIVFAGTALLVALPVSAHDAPRKHTHTKSGRVVWSEAKPATADVRPAAATEAEERKDAEKAEAKADVAKTP